MKTIMNASKWSVLSALISSRQTSTRLNKYIVCKDELNFNNIKFPIKLYDYKNYHPNSNIKNLYAKSKYYSK